MRQSYLDYAMSVIVGRALPDVRDGLKPVHRRVLFSMSEQGNVWNRAYRKSARVVGDVMGKYHPHGDSAIYDTMVRMAQRFSMRYLLVDGQGNFGCFTGDTLIKLADGTEKTFAELAQRPSDEIFYVYAVDETGKIVIAEGRHARMTRPNAELLALTLDTGDVVRCTPDHRFMLRDGSYKEARDLTPDDSLMPGVFDTAPVKPGLNDYLRILQPNLGRYQFVHHLADEFNVESLHVSWSKPEYRQKVMQRKIAGYVYDLTRRFPDCDITPELYESNRYRNWIPRLNKAVEYFGDFEALVTAGRHYNHRVVSMRRLTVRADTYDITVDHHHNFLLACGVFVHNSVDGDPPAAMRYTEVRMTRIADALLDDLDKDTVDFIPNYDNTEHEPVVLPARFPNLLVNGSSGIAVGMATNIPPHNLREVIDACLALIDNPAITIEELMVLVPGPDFPTAALINGVRGIREAYRTGRGRAVIRARTMVEVQKRSGREAIVVTELPYQVNKARLLERIAELVKEKKIEGIAPDGLRDESDKDGMRVVIELKRDAYAEVLLANLYQHTQMQQVFGINMVALVDGQPRTLNLKQILEYFIRHRRDVVTRRTLFELRKARDRAHVLEGYAIALANIDEIIALIKASANPAEARERLMERTWTPGSVTGMLERAGAEHTRPEELEAAFGLVDGGYRLSERQAKAILDLQLQRLTGLEQDKILDEFKEILDKIAALLMILSDSDRLMDVIREELAAIRDQFGDERRTEIQVDHTDLTLEDMIAPEEVVVTMSHQGYVKAQPISDYQAQRRGGKGKSATSFKEEDFIDRIFVANSRDTVLCFSSRGRVYWLKVYELPQAGRGARGRPMVNLLPLEPGERINAVLPVRDYETGYFVFMATSAGTVKKTPLDDFSRPLSRGIIAIDLREDEVLIGVAITDGKQDLMLFTSAGKAVRFSEGAVRAMGRTAHGVRGVQLAPGQKVISLLVAEPGTVLSVTENGYGKRTRVEDFPTKGRGTKGVIGISTSERNGAQVGAVLVRPDDEIMLITEGGTLIRTPIDQIPVVGRSAQGVKLINLGEGERLVYLERIVALDGEKEGNGDLAEDRDPDEPTGDPIDDEQAPEADPDSDPEA
ncbi:DNA gyrase subunit A [Thiocapsa rosea]|uniref:DNA topoisomerase (ATP-hydrolyzing) n=1 Tax=Thiocapsa rosea TaxID=69360 RepID=A0A495V074_9GAMM|nr:DNA gyrase subunit A [Thiocapsa rosea]